jgi:predicted GTPase
VASTALAAAVQIGQTQSTSIMVQRLQQRGLNINAIAQPIDIRTQVLYNPGTGTQLSP